MTTRETNGETVSIAVLDYGSGNVRSALRALEHLGARVLLTRDPQEVQKADGLLVPGVGAFASVVESLKAVQGHRMISRRVAGGGPVLGICVGMQIFFDQGVEHGIVSEGLAEWPGSVDPLDAPVVPHMGWNTVRPPEGSVLFRGIEQERFYFVHSYGVQKWDFDVAQPLMKPPQVTWSRHGGDFIAAVENGPLSAVQFHPEKSSDAGLRLLKNWMDSFRR